MPRRKAAALAAIVILASTTAATGCRDAPAALGATPAAARTHADDLFRGLGVRFVNVQRHPRFQQARGKLGRYALSPSKLLSDTSIWTSAPSATVRLLELDGRPIPTGYMFTPRASVAAPTHVGESRHVMRLERLHDDEYQWQTLVEHGIGSIAPEVGAAGFSAWLEAFQRPEHDIRRDVHTMLPRTSAALGRLFALDSVRSVPLVDGSSVVDLTVSVDGKRVRPMMPALADYVDKYVKPGRYVIELLDAHGNRYFRSRMGGGAISFHFRTRDGKLLAFDGPARAMPDSVTMYAEIYERFLIFDVGVSEMVGDFVQVRGAKARGWAMHFRQPPHWHLPFAVRHLIAGPLDRPFAGSGILFSLVLRDDGPQTLLVRQLDVAVKESAIVRWLGGLGGKAMEDFAGRAEAEENRFTADALLALRADVVAALGGQAAGP